MSEAMPLQHLVLRRSGRRPLAFNGMLLVEHPAAQEPGQRTHAVRIYEAADGSLVIEVALGSDDCGVPHVVVEQVDSMAEAKDALCCHDPAAQAAFTVGHGGIVQHAAALEQEANRLRADYQKALSAIFLSDHAPYNNTHLSEERTN